MSDFDINQHLNTMRFGQGSAGGGGDSGTGEAMTPETLIQKGISQTVQTWVCKVLGIGINPEIEGKSALSGFDPQTVGSGFSISNAPVLRDLRGGMLASILNYFTREFSHLLGSSSDGGGGGGGDVMASGGGGDFGGGGGGAQGGGGDMPTHMAGGPAATAPEAASAVSYGDHRVSGDMLIADLGNLRPTPTPVATGGEQGSGMAV